MNKGMLTVGIILLAIIGLLLINIISNYSTGSELEYYLVKETAKAAMEDAIDVKYYRDNGSLRMDKEKFVESFLRRFANSIDNTRNYRIGFYDLNEVPPKVSIKVDSATVLNFEGENLLMSTTFDGIVESIKTEDEYIEKANNDPDNELGYAICMLKDGTYENVKDEEQCNALGGTMGIAG